MQSFPMFIRTTGRRVLVVGGGEQAAQKLRLLLKTDAALTVVAPALDGEIQALVDAGRVEWSTEALSPAMFQGAPMVFVGTGCVAVDACAHALAKEAGVLVNVVDQPALCDMTTPALVDRDPVVVAIGSEGTAPVLTREIKTRLETILPQNLGGLAALAGRLRPEVDRQVPRAQRRALWAWVFKGSPRAAWEGGAEREAARSIKEAITKGAPPKGAARGQIALVGAGPGARDLLTLRAVSRLQEADVIFYDRLVDEEVLELARRDAERVFVGKHVGAHAWSQDRINQVIVAEALKGRRVVRLKSGDPGIFGRATEELEAAEAKGIPVEIVPGITAASAAGAALGSPLTVRGETDTLVLTTGMARDGAPSPDCTRHAAPGTTLAFYMSVGQAGRIAQDLQQQGMPGSAIVEIAAEVSKPGQRFERCTLATLTRTVARIGLKGCAVILVRWPHTDTESLPLAKNRLRTGS